jgi:hypothetical protein
MLKIRTPNGEIAKIDELNSDLFKAKVHALAHSEDFESEITIHRRYAEKNTRQYKIHLLSNQNLLANNIYDLRDRERDERIGILAPITAFSSLGHNRSEDEYFTSVASGVFWELLKDSVDGTIDPEWSGNDEFEIANFYPENTAILVVPSSQASTFDINKYIPSLFSYGYCTYCKTPTSNPSWKFKGLPAGKELKIWPIDGKYLGDGYIEALYKDLLPNERNPLAGFLLQYQVLEMLMQHVLDDRVSSLKIEVNNFYGSASDLRDLFDPLQKVTSERERIRAVVEKSKINAGVVSSLSALCGTLLNSSSKPPKSSHFSDLLYDVRNLIFHNYRSINSNNHAIIDSINKELVLVLPSLLTTPP